jgi:hypothetical protein
LQHLSEVASRIVPHDEANLLLLAEDGVQYRLYASTRPGVSDLVCREGHSALRGPLTAHLLNEILGRPGI